MPVTMSERNIIVTNDDGVHARGLIAAYNSVKDLGNAVVVAPSVQRSGVGRSISIFDPIRVSTVDIGVCSAYSIRGTPTDAVIVGIYGIMKCVPDLLIAGFNVGENLSTESVTSSGTIGAALEAASNGVPSIAVSVQVTDQGEKFDDLRDDYRDYGAAVKIINRIASKVLNEGLPDGVEVLNVNFPHDFKENTEIAVTRLARKIYRTEVRERFDPRGRKYYWIDGGIIRDAEEGTDVNAVINEGKISITPLSLDSTATVESEQVRKLL